MTKYTIGETLRINGRRDGTYRGNGVVEVDSEKLIEPFGEWAPVKHYRVTIQPQWQVERLRDIQSAEAAAAMSEDVIRLQEMLQAKYGKAI